jgi:hypothetical protein
MAVAWGGGFSKCRSSGIIHGQFCSTMATTLRATSPCSLADRKKLQFFHGGNGGERANYATGVDTKLDQGLHRQGPR